MSFFDRVCSRLSASPVFVVVLALPVSARPVRHTSDGILKASPVFSKRSTELIYAVLENPERFRLIKMNLADRRTESLRKDTSTAEFEPACSRDGRYCAFVRQRGVLSF